jgi:membrane protein YdbS with pleckstrin-like domain
MNDYSSTLDSTSFENPQLYQTALPSVEAVEFKKHPRRYLPYLLITSIMPFTFILLGGLILMLFGLFWWGLAAVGAWLLIIMLISLEEIKGFPIRGYAIRQHDITYKKGWLFFSKTTVPFNRIQHGEIVQGPIAQLFELSELRLFTAGGSVSDLPIGGLPYEEAQRLREAVTKYTAYHD